MTQGSRPFRVILFFLALDNAIRVLQVHLPHVLDVYLRHGEVLEGLGRRGKYVLCHVHISSVRSTAPSLA
jgi:hypothetical protein